jgi:NDMA-dependent alcohol dehydrogenase
MDIRVAPVQLEHPGGEPVEQMAIVGHQHEATPKRQKALLQPGHGTKIEVVGGLVQHEELGRVCQNPSQGHSLCLPAREGLHVHIEVPSHAEAIEGGLGLPSLPHRRADRSGWEHRYLLKKTHPRAAAPPNLSFVRLIHPGDDPQQGRLSRSVDPDDPDPISVGDGEREILEQHPVYPADSHLLEINEEGHDGTRVPAAGGSSRRCLIRWRRQRDQGGGAMQTEAAILWETHADWSVEPIELDPPPEGEVLVRLAASGLCHSDEHLVTGDIPGSLPVIGGHEGSGTIEEVGPGVHGLAPGDHVVFGFVPACGECPSCATGHSNLCDLGAIIMLGRQLDGTSRHHARGQDLRTMVCLGTFSKYTVVNQASCVKILDDIPLDKAGLVGCGVTTGWGSSVYAGEVGPGDNVAVIGVGGIGVAAIQGARLAGVERIFAIDIVESKRDLAPQFGATHTAASIEEAFELIRQETWGRMCDQVICAMSLGSGALMASILALTAKRGRVVVTNVHPRFETEITMSMSDLTRMEKQIVGSVFGSSNIRYDIPKLLKLYRDGQLDLDSMITTTYKLGDINLGYPDMRDGKNVRGVLIYDD